MVGQTNEIIIISYFSQANMIGQLLSHGRAKNSVIEITILKIENL